MQLYLIRHGESANNRLANSLAYDDYMAIRTPDPELTAVGRGQADLVAAHVASSRLPEQPAAAGYGITRLYSSPMLRALETAQPIAQALRLPIRVWTEIHEDGGTFTGNPRLPESIRNHRGLSRQQMEAQFPGCIVDGEIGDDGWWSGGHEPIELCEGRAEAVAAKLRTWASGELETDKIALVTHGTFADRLLKALLDVLPRSDFYFYHYNTAITRIDLSAGFVLLRYTNRTLHLASDLLTE